VTYSEPPRFSLPTMTPAILRLILVNVAVFVANALTGGSVGDWLAVSWPAMWEGYGLGLLRTISYAFTHSFVDPMHLILNMLCLYFFGTMAEVRIGYWGTYKLYFASAFVALLLHLGMCALAGGLSRPLVGASGACYAFLVYAACMAPRSWVIVIVFPVQLWLLAAVLVFIGIYATYVDVVSGSPGSVAHSAHVGGALFGFVAYRRHWFLDWTPHAYQRSPWTAWRQRFSRWRAARQARRIADDQMELDRILEKVKASGMTSLTAAERSFLDRFSARSR
jgi:membrane associated rhomboid family serine protease